MDITGENVKAALDEKGIKYKALADYLGLTQDKLSKTFKGIREFSSKEVDMIREFLAVHTNQNTSNLSDLPPQEFPRQSPKFPSERYAKEKKIPIKGTGMGGEKGSFIFNGQDIDWIACPAKLEHVMGAFAIIAQGDSMEPKFESGDTLYIHPHLPPRAGRHVVVELHGENGDNGDCFIKKLKKINDLTITLEQYNPPKTFNIARERVKFIGTIVGTEME